MFLTNLFDARLDLLPEYPGAKVFWLFHDNYLAAKLLETPRPDLARRVRTAIARHGVTNSGKIEILFNEAARPLPFRAYLLTNLVTIGEKTIRTEIVTDRVIRDWEKYADLLLLATVAESASHPAEARRLFERADALWDGRGLADVVVEKGKRYATYKLALHLIAARRLQLDPPHAALIRARLLALQNPEGGWITDYDSSLRPVGMANVETTCLAMLALRGDK